MLNQYLTVWSVILKELMGIFFKFSLISFHSLASLNSILFCPADLETRGKK